MIKTLNEKNNFKIYSVHDLEFKKYGKILKYDISDVIEVMNKTAILEKNIYVAHDENLAKTDFFAKIKAQVYGNLDIQIGYCNGHSNKLNALEYHIGSEVNIAITDLCLFLATQESIVNNVIDSKKVQAFFIPKGTIIELNQGILHFAPCKTENSGFKCVVCLLSKTNEEIAIDHINNKYLFKFNKWLYVHKDRPNLIDLGAQIGIIGENLEINF